MKKSQFGNFQFKQYDENEIFDLTSIRNGEIKIGQKLTCHVKTDSKFVVLGICEDLGPQANGGFSGASKAFQSFISKFLSIQSNRFLDGTEIVIPGYIESTNKTEFNFNKNPNVIDELDDFVFEILNPFLNLNLIPIVIGGGHNNAYPIIKSISLNLQKPISVVNCDAHADFRARDFRHSGNPFSFAFYEKFLNKYAVLGLHQSYNNQYILNELEKNQFIYTFYDDYLFDNKQFTLDFIQVDKYFNECEYGIELDMDSIEYMPSSASSPSGISFLEARKYISHFAKSNNVKYLHLPEAAPKTKEEELYVGKSLAYLVSDFIKNNSKH